MSDACEYAAATRRPFRTFLTLTFDLAARDAIAAGDTTIGAEVRRFFDAAGRAWSRGWQGTDTRGRQFQAKGHPGRLRYLWVAECPPSDTGEPNPHAHVLLAWEVPRRQFDAWAARLERQWGHGFAHLERLRKPREAGGYMLKALGYVTKGARPDAPPEFPIRGNRYFIARAARAPRWELEWSRELGCAGTLLELAGEHQRARIAPLIAERDALQRGLQRTPAAETKRRRKLGKRLDAVRQQIRGQRLVPLRFGLVARGADALAEVMHWMLSPGHWHATRDVPELPEKTGPTWANAPRPEPPTAEERRAWQRWRWHAAEQLHRVRLMGSAIRTAIAQGWAAADREAWQALEALDEWWAGTDREVDAWA